MSSRFHIASKRKGWAFAFLFSLGCLEGTAQLLTVKQLSDCSSNGTLIGATTTGTFLGWHKQEGGTAGINAPSSLSTWVQPSAPTTYVAIAQFKGENLIKNGDFELDTAGMYQHTDYVYHARTDYPGDYAILTNPNNGRSTHVYAYINDHTKNDGTGNMMVLDGDTNVHLTSAFKYAIPVVEGANYSFSVWVANIHRKLLIAPVDTSVNKLPRLQFRINGQAIGEYDFPFDSLWHSFSVDWTSPKTDTILLDVVDLERSNKANDFALDDFDFHENVFKMASILVMACEKTNVFSPDGDGVLDTYYIEDAGNAKIYDLGGNLVRELSIPGHWDGTKPNGALADAGYYAVVVNNSKSYRVSLMR